MFDNNAMKKNISSSRGRNPQLNSSSKDNTGVHLPPMLLTPTEQNRIEKE
jgi:hypothetical protein